MNQATARVHPGMNARTNEDWLSELRRDDFVGQNAVEELRGFVRNGLGRAFGKHGDLDDATLEDVTQDTLIRIMTKLDQFRGDSKFTTWAMSIAIRVTYTALRRRRWGERSLEDLGLSADSRASSLSSTESSSSGPTDRGDLLSSLRNAIDRDLTPRQRAVVLGELAGMPTAILAEQLETNPNALYKLHHDARLRLKTSLGRCGFSEADVRNILQGSSNG